MARLIDPGDSLLVIVDAQPGFYGDTLAAASGPMRGPLDRIAWLAATARAFGIPALATEEDPARNGRTAARILSALPGGSPVLVKSVFGAADQPDILAAIDATERRTAILVGLETDVCVAHTALGLLDRGFRVAVVADATFAPSPMHDAGLRRVAALGAEVVHAKGIYYEWVRTLEAARAFEREHPDLAEPPGFSL
ncbi:MAG: isochorismatase family protein [Chloroflexota bacterium]|jgi:nicotinamidase-related amidase|nr:isochorismatase family protein [Chloroflexota bacterium]MDH5242309.1 isochorismatase family protein [Chloroflexota bacterium]